MDNRYQLHKEKIKARSKAYHAKHRESILLKQKEYRESKREQIAENKKAWYEKNKERVKKAVAIRSLARRKVDLQFKLALNLRRRVNKVLRGQGIRAGSAVKDSGSRMSTRFAIVPGASWSARCGTDRRGS